MANKEAIVEVLKALDVPGSMIEYLTPEQEEDAEAIVRRLREILAQSEGK
jgi:hypothetical protein